MAQLDLRKALQVYWGDSELSHIFVGGAKVWERHNPIVLELSLTADVLGRVGEEHTIVFTAYGDPSYEPTYAWEFNGDIVEGATSSTYTPIEAGNLTGIVTVTNENGTMTRRTPTVACETFDIVAFLGQSNAVTNNISGSGSLPVGWTNNSRVKFLKNISSVWQWVTYNPSGETNWGPEVAYAMEWLADNPTGTLGIVKRAVSGTQLGAISIYGKIQGASDQDWSFEPGMLYEESHNMYLAAKALSPAGKLVDIMWLAGGSDIRNANTKANYFDNCSALFDAFRDDWDVCPIKMTTLSPVTGSYDWTEMLTITRNICDAFDDVYIGNVSSLTYQGDNLHLTAASTNVSGGIFYNLGREALAPFDLAISASTVAYNAAQNTTIGTLTAKCYNGTDAVVWSLVTASTQYELNGNTLRVKRSGTTPLYAETLTIRATSSDGFYTDINVNIENTAWWNTSISAPYMDLDFENDRYFYAGKTYSWAGLEALGVAQLVDHGAPVVHEAPHILVPNTMTNTYAVVAKVTNGVYNSGSANTIGTGAEYAWTIDDNEDTSTSDNFVGWGRSAANNFRRFVSNGSTTTWNATETGNAMAADSAGPFGVATRIKPASFATAYSNADSSGSSSGSNGGATPQPVRLMVGNSGAGICEWTGTIHRVTVYNDRTNAQLRTEANFIAA